MVGANGVQAGMDHAHDFMITAFDERSESARKGFLVVCDQDAHIFLTGDIMPDAGEIEKKSILSELEAGESG